MVTPFPDDINLSARLEGFNKTVGTRCMVSEKIAEKIRGFLLLRDLMPILVVGKLEPVLVSELVGIRPGIVPEKFLESKETVIDGRAVDLPNNGNNNLKYRISSGVGSVDDDNQSAYSEQSAVSNMAMSATTIGEDGLPTTTRRKRKIINDKKAHITALRCLKNSMKHTQSVLIASDLEVKFVTEYNEALEKFRNGDAMGCETILKRLRNEYPVFYDDTGNATTKVEELKNRCSAAIMTAELSTVKLEAMCTRCKDSTSLQDFVYVATEK